MALNNPAPLSCQNIVSFDANKTPNITAVSGCNIGCRFCKCLVIKPIRGKTGIRTLGTRKGTTVFETAPIDHSGTFPFWSLYADKPSCLVCGCKVKKLFWIEHKSNVIFCNIFFNERYNRILFANFAYQNKYRKNNGRNQVYRHTYFRRRRPRHERRNSCRHPFGYIQRA